MIIIGTLLHSHYKDIYLESTQDKRQHLKFAKIFTKILRHGFYFLVIKIHLDEMSYNNKTNKLINFAIRKGICVIKENYAASAESKSSQKFVYRNLKKYEKHKEMRPTSSPPAKIFAAAKTHKFTDIKEININDLKLHPVINQTGTNLMTVRKQIANILQPLAINEYITFDTYLFLVYLEKS